MWNPVSHLGVYKQPYCPCRLCDWNAAHTCKTVWIDTNKSKRHCLKWLFQISFASPVLFCFSLLLCCFCFWDQSQLSAACRQQCVHFCGEGFELASSALGVLLPCPWSSSVSLVCVRPHFSAASPLVADALQRCLYGWGLHSGSPWRYSTDLRWVGAVSSWCSLCTVTDSQGASHRLWRRWVIGGEFPLDFFCTVFEIGFSFRPLHSPKMAIRDHTTRTPPPALLKSECWLYTWHAINCTHRHACIYFAIWRHPPHRNEMSKEWQHFSQVQTASSVK